MIAVLDEGDGVLGGAGVCVLIHLEGDLHAVLLGVVGQLPDAFDGQGAQLGVVDMPGGMPEPQAFLLFRGQVLHETDVEDLRAELRAPIEHAVHHVDMFDAVVDIDRAASTE